ncbi:hypothetical protein GCM10027190_15990 [Spirosoma areae]
MDDYGKSTYHVVDGKQRLETILDFAENKIAIDANFGDANLNGRKFKDIPTEFKRKLWDYILVVDYVESINGNSINDIFDRVNRNAKNLEPQELRHARYDGWFIKLVENEASEPFWVDFKITTSGREKRMKNVQFISELFLVIIDSKIVGFNQDYLDKNYAELDSPEEENPDFDTEEFIYKKERVKSLIEAINGVNNCVLIYTKSQAHFYTLWALVSLNLDRIHQLGHKEFATRYADFMHSVGKVPTDKLDTRDKANLDPYTKYAMFSGGASTDAMPRYERLHALSLILE